MFDYKNYFEIDLALFIGTNWNIKAEIKVLEQ